MLQKREFRLKFLNATVKFIPEVVGGKEVYSVLNAIDEHFEHVKLELLDRVDSCYLSAYIYENDGKRSNLINVNSNEEKILPKDTKLEIL